MNTAHHHNLSQIGALNINEWIEKNLFEVIPMSTAVIDKDFNIITANKAFESMFGDWQGQKCYSVYKNRDSMCAYCKGAETFKDGQPRVSKEIGYNKEGRLTHYLKHTIPVLDEGGKVPFLIEMATDVTETEKLREEYKLLFEQVPCDILILDRDFKIHQTNRRAKEVFGKIEGDYCYQILKGRKTKCTDCTAGRTFKDGKLHMGRSTVINKKGERVEFLVTTVPFQKENGKFDLVLEMAVDITETLELQEELKVANTFMKSMISSSLYGSIAIDANDKITIFNDAAKAIFKVDDETKLSKQKLVELLPKGLMELLESSGGTVNLSDVNACALDGEKVAIRLIGINMVVDGHYMGKVFWIQDLSDIKNLESEKLEAERLAAVGQTVAGLAHGIKNVLTGLEGGIYLLNTGLQKGKADRSKKGMEMLNRNTARVSTFVKEFLNFSKGQEIQTVMCDPVDIAREVVEMFSAKIEELGIEMSFEHEDVIQPAAFDEEGMLECLSNLVGNAIDACRLSDDTIKSKVLVKAYERDATIIYEVIDNGCGMDYEVKRKVFTTFFTTKGLGGTGLGLLMTKKIIQQHGGKVEFDTNSGKGTTFRITLPRKRLPEPSINGFVKHV